ncbi:hypothetical protein ACJX0J_013180, partial [Zea mays]
MEWDVHVLLLCFFFISPMKGLVNVSTLVVVSCRDFQNPHFYHYETHFIPLDLYLIITHFIISLFNRKEDDQGDLGETNANLCMFYGAQFGCITTRKIFYKTGHALNMVPKGLFISFNLDMDVPLLLDINARILGLMKSEGFMLGYGFHVRVPLFSFAILGTSIFCHFCMFSEKE